MSFSVFFIEITFKLVLKRGVVDQLLSSQAFTSPDSSTAGPNLPEDSF